MSFSGIWNLAKRKLKRQCGTSDALFDSYLQEFEFDITAAVVYHRNQVIDFLKDCVDLYATNLKQQSVLADMESDEVVMMVLALGVMYVFLTGPFWLWVLIQADMHYLHLYGPIQRMRSSLETLVNDEEEINKMLQNLTPVLPGFSVKRTPEVNKVIDLAI